MTLDYGIPNDIDATGVCCCNGCISQGPCDLDLLGDDDVYDESSFYCDGDYDW